MSLSKKLNALNLALLMLAMACSNRPKHVSHQTPVSSSTTMSQAMAKKADASAYLDIEFSKGSAQLQQSDKTSLNQLLQQSKQHGDINEVIVLSWSDQEYPSKKAQELSDGQEDLAQRRNAAVKNYIKNYNRNIDVDTYNMAERPNALAELFKTPDSRIKNSLVAAGLATNTHVENHTAKASHSVVLVKTK